MKCKPILLNVVDAGARYGLHPTWEPLKKVAQFHLFEIDAQEIERLNQKYKAYENIHLIHKGLYKHAGKKMFHRFAHKGLTSIFSANQNTLRRLNFMVKDYQEKTQTEVSTVSVDQYFSETDIHFIKMDTEGSELDILKGAEQQLQNSVLGVRSEVHFTPVYKDQPDFGKIHRHLNDRGFELLNLDYVGRGHPSSKFTRPDRFGQLIGCDAVWIRQLDKIFHAPSADQSYIDASVIRMAIFLMLNHATDMAINLLLTGMEQHGCNYEPYRFDDPLFRELDRQVQILFKALQYEPYGDDSLQAIYEYIFKKPLKTMHRYYESDLFE